MDETTINAFLSECGWGDARLANLAGDASQRRYMRVRNTSGASAVLMIAPPETANTMQAFRRVGGWLNAAGFHAPKEYGFDAENGLMLLEDFGDISVARLAPDGPEMEQQLYKAATDILARLHKTAPPAGLPRYRSTRMVDYAMRCFHTYRDGIGQPAHPSEETALRNALEQAFVRIAQSASVITLRDYHAENILVLNNKHDALTLGLIDHQDAAYGFAPYDLASLLQDARRDLASGLEASMIAHYLAQSDVDPQEFRFAYALCGAQRGLRLTLQFPALALTHGKTRYLDLMPRVWKHLQRCLSAPDLRPLRAAINAHIPPPTDNVIHQLRARAACVE